MTNCGEGCVFLSFKAGPGENALEGDKGVVLFAIIEACLFVVKLLIGELLFNKRELVIAVVFVAVAGELTDLLSD